MFFSGNYCVVVCVCLLFMLSHVHSFLPAGHIRLHSNHRVFSFVEGTDGNIKATPADCCNTGTLGPHQTNSSLFGPGPVTLADLSDENIVKIVTFECTDGDANVLVWNCLGYVYNEQQQSWDSTNVFPKWREKYPQPVDLIGVTRNYNPEVDKPVRTASMALMRGIPRDFKGGLRNLQNTVGFQGFKISELTPNITRRAQLVNWLMYYRANLFGKTLDELKQQRLNEAQPDVSIETLPSQKQYNKERLA